jgi:hypothetical protein
MTDDRGNLSRQIDMLAFQFQLEHAMPATHILLPKKSPSEIKAFVEALCDEIDGLGSRPVVYERFISAEPFTHIADFRDLEIMLYDGSQLIVGRADGIQ